MEESQELRKAGAVFKKLERSFYVHSHLFNAKFRERKGGGGTQV